MNSTLTLCVFLFNMWRRKIYWEFSSEVIPMLVVVLIVGLRGTLSNNIRTVDALLMTTLYPLSFAAVAILQSFEERQGSSEQGSLSLSVS